MERKSIGIYAGVCGWRSLIIAVATMRQKKIVFGVTGGELRFRENCRTEESGEDDRRIKL